MFENVITPTFIVYVLHENGEFLQRNGVEFLFNVSFGNIEFEY
jgi:hypothetical protein